MPPRLLLLLLLGTACTATVPRGAEPLPLTLPDGSVYEGSLRDGRPHGEGRLVWPSGAVYEGPFRDGQPHGEGRLVRASGRVYEGPFVRGVAHGEGRVTYPSGGRYQGDFRNGEPHGAGSYVWANGVTYEGEVRHGELQGHGRLTHPNGTVYEGGFENGDFEGKGTLRSADGSVYEGEFHADEFHGLGTLRNADGSSYTGAFEEGLFHGEGRWDTGAGAAFEGRFQHGEFTGRGTYRTEGGFVYAGDFVEWDFNGHGTAVTPGGSIYVGAFRDDRFHGQGRLVRPDGRVYVGGFEEGRFHGEGVLRWIDEAGEEREAHGVWEQGRYVRGDADELLPPPPVDAEALLFAQPERLRDALARVAPSRPGVPDLYFLGFGAWEAQKVFAREVLFARRLFETQLGARERTLVLLNHRPTLAREPLATVTNLEHALRGLAERMDVEEDVLFLFLTSHGDAEEGISVSFDGLPLHDLSPARLDAMLDAAGIRWRVVLVSACYSGTFVEPLSDGRTLVMTAAAADRTSFGCSDDAEFTFFGDAFLRDALPGARSFAEAFARARARVAELEATEGVETPSSPQMALGAEVEAQLAAWRAALRSSPGAAQGGATLPAAPAGD